MKERVYMVKGYMTAKDVSAKWGVTMRTVQTMCAEGRIEGAVKFGRDWAIPMNAQRPEDGRIISGKYVDWRKNTNQNGNKDESSKQ